jgi:predicted ATP-grasp superfamily ATP-dependent carboligase
MNTAELAQPSVSTAQRVGVTRGPAPGGVVIGSDFQSLGAVRSLRERGVPIFLVEYERGIARFSRHVNRRAVNYDLFNSGTGVEFMLTLARREKLDGWVLFANNDDGVKFLSRNRDALSEKYRVPVPAWNITRNFYDKGLAYRLAQKAGIPIPLLYEAETLDSLLEQDLRFPLVLKPKFKENYYEKTHRKAILVQSREQLIVEFRQMTALIPASQIVVQELIPGGPRNLYSFGTVFDGQRAVAGMTAKRSRQHPMVFGHATTFAETVDIPQIEELAVRFLRAIEYRGIAEVEFMYDERDACFKFIEMNGRVWGWHTLAKAAGVNLPYALYELALDRNVQSARPNTGVKWIRSLTDTPIVIGELLRRHMSVADYLRSRQGKTEYAVFSWSDPLPSLMEIALLPYLWWKKGF